MSDVSPDENTRNPFTRPGFIISAALVLALIAAVIVIAFIPRGGDEPDAGSTEPTSTETTSAPSATAAGVEESICGLPSSGETALGTAPESDWELVGTIAAPTSPEQHGPGVVSDEVRSCFSNDVTGALYAAVNIAALAGLGEEEKLYSELSVPSPAQQQALENASTSPANNSISVPNPRVVDFLGCPADRARKAARICVLGMPTAPGRVPALRRVHFPWGSTFS
ncbi:hypothetical protein, partial [Arthrobacter sp. AET 35A]|uniref:hypothetical protein n=1 Tax=Arthrobacter sp. AET 35A TaxID=2292643 RepID=UPI001CE37400